jgi:ATP-binding cassette subfamily B (MDR/TAP) protein 1
MQLIERFYDIEDGSITLDGKPLKSLNLKSMRSHIGYVGQEPVLFATSVRNNMLLADDKATDDQIWEALRSANAEKFVKNLEDGLDTFVGTSGI